MIADTSNTAVTTKAILLIVLATFSSHRLHAQVIESWDILSALDQTAAVLVTSSGRNVAGTTGGAYRFSTPEEITDIWRSNGELLDLSVTAIGEDPESGDLYFGSSTGSISILRNDGGWSYVGDLARVDKPEREITGFAFHDGSVYVLSSFGVSIFNRSDSTFRDSWTRLGAFQADTRVNDLVVRGDTVFLATASGLALAELGAGDLADPLNWRTYSGGDCEGEVFSLAQRGAAMILGGEGGLCRYEAGAISAIASTPGGLLMSSREGRTVGVAGSTVWEVLDGSVTEIATLENPGTSISLAGDGSILVGTEQGAVVLKGDESSRIIPDGPASNSFPDLALDRTGGVWVATGDRGVSRFSDERWENFTSETTERITNNGIRTISTDHTGRVWGGSFGDGFYRFEPDAETISITHFDETNSPLQATSKFPDITVAESVDSDDNGVVWALNWDNTDGRRTALYSYEYGPEGSAGTWTPHPFSGRFFSYTKTFRWIAVDLNGTKWIAGNDKPQGLLYYVNENSDPQQPGVWNALTTTHGLPQNDPTAILVDPDGEIWVGTPVGLSILVNPFGVRQDGPSAAIFREVRSLDDVFIWDIAVDALNRKWIGTDQGAFLISSDGTELISHFTEANSALSNNVVRSIAIDRTTGFVYLGTENGLNRLRTEAVESVDPEEIIAAPQPFLAGVDQRVRLEGLPGNASVKILTTDGRVVREYRSPGGAIATWDGRDADGNLVATGVYLVFAESPLGETSAGKIALIRE